MTIQRKYYEIYGTVWLGDQIADCQDCDWLWNDLGDDRDDAAQDHIDENPTHVVALGDKRLRFLRKRNDGAGRGSEGRRIPKITRNQP